jgi:predicted DNA-binding protein
MKKNTSVRLSLEQHEFLTRKAQQLGCSRSALIKSIIYAYHTNHQRGGYLVKEVADIVEAIKA